MEVPVPAAIIREDDEHQGNEEDFVTPVANVAMTPFSVIASTCLQVILNSSSTVDKPQAFNLLSASVVATAGMLMAVYLVTLRSCSDKSGKEEKPMVENSNTVMAVIEKLLFIRQPVIDVKERVRICRMMLRCLWFSLSFMTTGLLCVVLRNQMKLGDAVSSVIAVVVWTIFVWSSFGAPLPRVNRCLRMAGSVFTGTFPVLLMTGYAVLFFTEKTR